MVKLILIGLCLCGSIFFTESAEWGYEQNNGPSTWPDEYPICAEKSQSPIAIKTDDTSVNASLGLFHRSIFDALPASMVIVNTGHSLKVELTGGYTISNPALLPGDFKIAQYHIHWGKPGQGGSEHTLNGKHYFGELHFVHYNTKYPDLNTAASKSDGLAVLGFFVEESYPQDNLAFSRFLDPIRNRSLEFAKNSTSITSLFSVETLLPPDIDVYYRYKGSLTTPACYESVVWSVFQTPIRISKQQAELLRSNLLSTDNTSLSGNFRPTQPLNGRKVAKSMACSGSGSISALSRSFQGHLVVMLAIATWIVC